VPLGQAHDGASAAVRAAVIDGLEYLMDCPQSIAPLQVMLPSLAPLLHDRSERVRVSFMKLLQVGNGTWRRGVSAVIVDACVDHIVVWCSVVCMST
jgi:hypothetical protein